MIRHPCDAQKSCSLRMISWKEEGFDIYDFRFGDLRFGIAWGIITDGKTLDDLRFMWRRGVDSVSRGFGLSLI